MGGEDEGGVLELQERGGGQGNFVVVYFTFQSILSPLNFETKQKKLPFRPPNLQICSEKVVFFTPSLILV